MLTTIADAFSKSGIQPRQIAGIGITNQRETSVIWDKQTGLPIHNAIVWQSRQTTALAEKLRQGGYGDTIHEKTGLLIDPYFSATKVRWLLDAVPGAQLAPSAVSCCLAPSTPGWPGSCPAARSTSPTTPTPAAR